jgi:hypothetical protein
MKKVSVIGGTYIVKIVKKKWYHKYFKTESTTNKIKLADITTGLYVDEKSKLYAIANNIELMSADMFIEEK